MHRDSGSNHGCRTWGPVAWAIRGVVGTLCLLVHGCDNVDGGAVELSWKLRPASSSFSDKFVDCNSEQPGAGVVTAIRLHWHVDQPDGGASDCSQAWSCDDNHGVTGFDLPEGTAGLWVTPECGPVQKSVECGPMQGQPAMPGTYIAPAPVQRKVLRGDTVSLGAVELVVTVSDCRFAQEPSGAGLPTQPCICDDR
jgi:hypothetical protein